VSVVPNISVVRPTHLLFLSFGSIFAYLISRLLIASSLLRVITAFPAVYLMPGLLLLLLLRKPEGKHYDVKKVVVEGFFISTVINVLIVSIFILIGVPLAGIFFPIVSICLMSILALINYLWHIPLRVSFTKADFVILGLISIAFLLATAVFSVLPHIPTPDETSYMTSARDVVLEGEIHPVGETTSGLRVLLHGRLFWILLMSSFLCSTGLTPPIHTSLISCMFLPMIALTSLLLVPSRFRDKGLLQVVLVLLLLSNPLLVEFSGFALNDLSLSFYLLFAIVFLVTSFQTGRERNPSIHFEYLALSILSFIVAFLVKHHTLCLLVAYLILLFYILKYRLYKVKEYRLLSYALIIIPIVYELAIDIPCTAQAWLGWTTPWTGFFRLRDFRIVAPFEEILTIFIPSPWVHTTIFTQGSTEYLSYAYSFLSPEVLGLVPVGIGLLMPTVFLLKRIRSDTQIKVLTSFTSISLLILFLKFTSQNPGLYGYFWDIPRFSLVLYPLIMVISVLALNEAFSGRHLEVLLAFAASSIIFCLIQIYLSASWAGRVYAGWGIIGKLDWTIWILIPQLFVYMVSSSLAKIYGGRSRIKITKHLYTLNVTRSLLSVLFLSILLSNLYFSALFLNNNRYFKESGLVNINDVLKEADTDFVLSNSRDYLRVFVSDDFFNNNYLFSLPMTKMELDEFIQKGFNGMMLVVIENPYFYELEYASVYANELLNGYVPVPVYEENLNSYGKIVIYRFNSSTKLHESRTDIIIKDVKVDSGNSSISTLKIDVNSPRPANLSIIVDTSYFSKVLDTTISQGDNHLEYPFEYQLSDGRYYGQYISEKCVVTIIEEDGNIIYAKTIQASFEDIKLPFTVVLISILLGVLFLMRRSKPARVPAYLVRDFKILPEKTKV